jgi:hypothetical protein
VALSNVSNGEPIDSMKIHLLWCAHKGSAQLPNDNVWDTFVSIAKDVWFYVSYE